MTPLAHDAFQGSQTEGDFFEERRIVGDEDKFGMLRPEFPQALIKFHGFLERFLPPWIAALQTQATRRRCFKKDHGIIPIQFVLQGGLLFGKEFG